MGKDKIRRFEENATFRCVVQPEFEEIFRKDYRLKGRWREDFFGNPNPIVLELGCGNDYENEKEDFEVDEADTVELINGERMPWEQVKRDGIDYIALYYVNEKGQQVQILDAELA